jgi:hypothetical protein
MKSLYVKLTFQEDLLGTSPNDLDIYQNFIADKAPDALSIEQEIEAIGIEEVTEKGITIFPRTKEGLPFLYDYQVKGFFKGAGYMLRQLTKKDEETGKRKKGDAINESSKLTNYKKVIDGLIFVFPRQIVFKLSGEITLCQRPLRIQTAQGERVALACSEAIPAGSSVEFEVRMLSDDHDKLVKEWLDYGIYNGMGQWRNSGKGRFTWEEIDKLG